MQEQQFSARDEEIDLRELMRAIWLGKWIIIAVTFIFAAGSVYYAKSLPNIYKSEVTLAPAGDSGGLNIPGQLGGLAALAGVNLGNKGGDKTAIALEILKSREFIGRFIEENDLYVPIMAAVGWDRASGTLLIDPEIYDESSKKWMRRVQEPFKAKPSNLETYKAFMGLLAIGQDKTTGIVTLSVESYSPILAKQWADLLVKGLNEEMRRRDLTEAKRSIEYLNSQISKTNLSDIRSMLYSLVEEQTKTEMLAHAREEYVLKTIDPAVVAEQKAGPKRALIVLMASILGLILSTMVVIVRYISTKNKSAK